MAAKWRNFKAKMKAKRIDKGKGKKKDTISAFNEENDTLVVQQLSAEVSGKAQKYSRIGAREFVSYEYEEFTIENIWRACKKHFAVDKSMSCDILAGEQGPSCNMVKKVFLQNLWQILSDSYGPPYICLVHIRRCRG